MLWENHRIELARVRPRPKSAIGQAATGLVNAFLDWTCSRRLDPFNAQGTRADRPRTFSISGAEKVSGNPSLQPEVRAQLLESIGLAYRRQGLERAGDPVVRQAGCSPYAVRNARSTTAASPWRLANLARALTDAGHFRISAEGLSDQQAVALSPGDGGRRLFRIETADILVQFGNFCVSDAKSDPARQAAQLFGKALNILYRATIGNQKSAGCRLDAERSPPPAAAVWMDDYPLAEHYQREALSIFQETVSRNHPDNAVALATLGSILTQRAKYAEAEQVLNEALQIERAVFGVDNPRIAQVEADLGMLYDREGDTLRAIAATQTALKITRDRRGSSHYMVGYHLDALASLSLKINDLPAAEADARQALAVYAQSLPARHLYVAGAHQLLGEVLLRRGSLAAAETELRAALDTNVELAGPDSWRTARSEASLGWMLIQRDKAAEGEPMLVAARSKLLATVGPQHPATQQATARLVEYYRARHRDADAARVLAAPDKR